MKTRLSSSIFFASEGRRNKRANGKVPQYRHAGEPRTLDKFVDMGSAKGALACTRPFRDGAWACGHFHSDLQKLMDLTVSSVRCSAEELKQVQSCIAACFTDVSQEDACKEFELTLKSFASAAFHGDRAFIRECCQTPGIQITDKRHQGGLAEMAVHISAASGDVQRLQTCLDLKADLNTEDDMRERPLHYAALAGCAPAIQVLLRANADPTARSGVKTELIPDLLGSAKHFWSGS